MPDLKSLFATPKKAALTTACVLVMLITLGVACALAAGTFSQGPAADEDAQSSQAAQGETQPPEESPDASHPGGLFLSKTIEEARELALADAGLTASGAVFTGETLREDNGLWVYQFHFQAGSTTYEYEINANTGAVYSKVIKTYVTSGPTPAPEPTPTPEPEATSAQAADGGASPRPDGSSEPQGGIPPADSGPVPTPETVPEMVLGPAYIGVAQAKAIALNHAGFTASQVMVTKASMDREDGRMVYEIEFRRNGVEYEYKIDAQSGAILAHEIDRD